MGIVILFFLIPIFIGTQITADNEHNENRKINFVSSIIFFIFVMEFSEKENEKEDVPTASKVNIDATLNIKHASMEMLGTSKENKNDKLWEKI